MGDDKGKGRARYEKEPEASQQDGSSQGSMFSRIAASASGLTRSSLATPGSNELNERATAALASAGKGQSSSQGASSAWAETSIRPEQRTQNVSHQGNGFRLGHEEEHVRTAENEFRSFLDATESFTPSQSVAEPSLENPSMGNSWGEAWARSQHFDETLGSEPQQVSNGRTISEQESRDGEEVLALLSGPSENESLENPVDESEEVDWNLTAEQMAQLRAMTKDLFPPPDPHKPIPSDHPLNLIPEFGASNIMKLPQTEANGEESYMYTGLNRETFREQWEDVLTRYTDEVWGGLLPLIKEARHEVEEMSNAEPSTEEPQALRRLRTILAHLKH